MMRRTLLAFVAALALGGITIQRGFSGSWHFWV
jgi:hypothetical protein